MRGSHRAVFITPPVIGINISLTQHICLHRDIDYDLSIRVLLKGHQSA